MSEIQLNGRHRWYDFVLIAVVSAYELGIVLFSLLWLFTNVFQGWKSGFAVVGSSGINEEVSYGLFLSGALGGAFYCLRTLYQRLADAYTPALGPDGKTPLEQLNVRVWALWYFYRPIQGGALALILLCLVKSHLLVVPELKSENEVSSFFVFVALGFIAGLGTHELIHKILEIIGVIFARSNIKVSTSKDKVREIKGLPHEEKSDV